MDEDEIVSVEEEIFYDYTVPSDIGLDGLDPSSNISNMTTDLPLELSSEVPLHLTGDGSQSTLRPIVDYLDSALGIDLVYIAGILFKVVLIAVLTYIAANMVRRAINVHLPRVTGGGRMGLDAETETTFRTLISRLLVAAIYVVGFLMIIYQIPPLSRVSVTLLAGAGVAG